MCCALQWTPAAGNTHVHTVRARDSSTPVARWGISASVLAGVSSSSSISSGQTGQQRGFAAGKGRRWMDAVQDAGEPKRPIVWQTVGRYIADDDRLILLA